MQQVITSNTGPTLVFPLIQPFGSDESSYLGKVYSRQATESVNCENSSVSFVMKYCPTSTVVRNPASVQNLLNLSCSDNFPILSPYLCNSNFFMCRIIIVQKHVFCWSHSAPTTGLPAQAELPPTSPECWPFSPALPVTLAHPLLPPKHGWLGRDKWGLSSPYHVAATYLFGQPDSPSFANHWRYCHADWTVPLQDVNSSFLPRMCHPAEQVSAHTQIRDPRESTAACWWHALGTPSPGHHHLSAILSHSPCGLSSLIEYHFFSDPGPRNYHCPAPNFLV